jgi:thiamine biosynthesis lipoprotein
MLEHAFRAMGTDVHVLLDAGDSPDAREALLDCEAEFARLEDMLSRFRPGSQLSRLNRSGALLMGPPELVEVLCLALDAREQTGGRFDPTILPALAAAGYDRTFADVRDSETPAGGGRCGGGVHVDRERGSIRLDPGVEIDLGGIAKGYTADRASAALDRHGPCLVNAGGDIAASRPPHEGAWGIGVETASGTFSLGLEAGGLATSGRDRRRWRRAGAEQHHVIDPARGRPAETDLLRVTAAGASAAQAEVRAKTLLMAGERRARREADERGIAAVLVTADCRTVLAGGLA